MNKVKTNVFVLLDKSGSMKKIRSETLSHLNRVLDTLKRESSADVDNTLSLVTFSDKTETVYFNKKISKVSSDDFTEMNYKTDSKMTYLYDAIGSSIDMVDDDADTSNLFVVITDGDDNGSQKYSLEDISSKISTLQSTNNWTFTFISASKDPYKSSKDMGFPKGNTLKFDANPSGVKTMSDKQSKSLGYFFTARKYGTTSTRGFFGSDK